MAMRGVAGQPLASGAPSPNGRHIGLDPGLIEKDQMLRREPALISAPPISPAGDVGVVLLTGQKAFF